MEFFTTATKKDLFARILNDFTSKELAFINRACEFSDDVMATHSPRGNGQPYSTHYYSAALMSAVSCGDAETIATLILHDCMEDGKLNAHGKIRDVRENDIILALSNKGEYQEESRSVARSVAALTNFKREEFGGDRLKTRAANFLKATEAFVKYDKVITGRMYDRLHNMLTITDKPGLEKQQETSYDTLNVLCPFAKSLGMYDIAVKMEDIAFSILMPEEYTRTKKILQDRQNETLTEIIKTKDFYSSLLEKKYIPHKMQIGYISLYSLYQSLQNNGDRSNQIHNLRVINPIILSDDLDMCHDAKRILKTSGDFTLCRGLDKDYITIPKDNFYQATHTVLHGRDTGSLYQIQICSETMYKINHYGYPAYLALKANHPNRKMFDGIYMSKKRTINDILAIGASSEEEYNLSENLNNELFGNIITVYTPQGTPILLPVGSIPHDFAYRLKTSIGNHMFSARINGQRIEELEGFTTELNNGDCVVIDHHPGYKLPRETRAKVLEYVKTAGARARMAPGVAS